MTGSIVLNLLFAFYRKLDTWYENSLTHRAIAAVASLGAHSRIVSALTVKPSKADYSDGSLIILCIFAVLRLCDKIARAMAGFVFRVAAHSLACKPLYRLRQASENIDARNVLGSSVFARFVSWIFD